MVNILLNGENVCNYNPLELQLFGYRILSQMCEKKCVCVYIYRLHIVEMGVEHGRFCLFRSRNIGFGGETSKPNTVETDKS